MNKNKKAGANAITLIVFDKDLYNSEAFLTKNNRLSGTDTQVITGLVTYLYPVYDLTFTGFNMVVYHLMRGAVYIGTFE